MKKKILLIIGIILILIMCIIAGGYIYLKQRDDTISLIKDNIIIEYGKTYNPTVEELIDLNHFNFIDLKKVKLESSIKNEDGKEYPSVGEYQIVVKYKEKNMIQKVVVRDTTSPELSIQDKIEIANGTDLSTYNFKDFIKTTDLSELKNYNIDFTNVNSNIAGEYNAKISIEDIYSNKTEKEFKIIIPELPVETVADNKPVENTPSGTATKNNSNSTSQKKSVTTSPAKQVSQKTTTPSTNSSPSVPSTQSSSKPTEPKVERCTNNHNHGMSVGNSNQWFASKSAAIAYYDNLVNDWDKKVKNDPDCYDDYLKYCPYGYEIWSCMYCNKWTINCYYR